MTALALIAALAVVALGAVIQGTAGFGISLVAVPLLLLIDPRLVPGPITVVTPFLSVLVLARDHRHPSASALRWPALGLVPGTVVGAVVVSQLSGSTLAVLAAVLVLLGVGLSLVAGAVEPTPRRLAGAGLLAGFMGTTAGLNGPPMALLHQGASGPALRVTMARFFLLSSAFALVGLSVAGRLGWWEVAVGLLLVPGVLVGFALSRSFLGWADAGRTRVVVLAISASSALVVLVRAALGGG